jgi:Sulfotransferase family
MSHQTADVPTAAGVERASHPALAPGTGARTSEGPRVPDFFIVGHAKSGTTALYEMLRSHPQIFMPDAKEPWFLASDMRARFKPRRGGAGPQTLEQYLSLFDGARPEQTVGEASSSYLWSRTAAREIAELQPAARIIAILREPASFLRSLHLQLIQTHVEAERDLRRALALEPARQGGRRIPRRSHRPQLLLYSQHVRYVEQLRRYHAAFAPEQVLVLVYDDFRLDNQGTVRHVLRFLDVDESVSIQVTEANPSVLLRSHQLDDLVHSVSVGRGPISGAVKTGLKAVTPRRLRRNALRLTNRRIVHRRPAPEDDELMRDLRRRFEPEVVSLSEYLGRDLVKLWGYDSLG